MPFDFDFFLLSTFTDAIAFGIVYVDVDATAVDVGAGISKYKKLSCVFPIDHDRSVWQCSNAVVTTEA